MEKIIQRVHKGNLALVGGLIVTIGLTATLYMTNDKINELENKNMSLIESVEKQESIVESQNKLINDLDSAIEKSENANKVLRTQIEEYKKKEQKLKAKTVSRGEIASQPIHFKATAYTPYCAGCMGITHKEEYNVRKSIYYNGLRIIAVDPSTIPYYSIVEISYGDTKFKAIALDKGGAIRGYKIDLLVENKSEAFDFGRRDVQIRILRHGK